MMMTSGEAVKYKGSMDAARQIFATEGVRSFFKGAGANILRGVAGAGVLSIYDRKLRFPDTLAIHTANSSHRGAASHVRQAVQGWIRLNESLPYDRERWRVCSQKWRWSGLQLARLHWGGNEMLVNNVDAANTRSIANRQQGEVPERVQASGKLCSFRRGFTPVPIVSYWFSTRTSRETRWECMHESSIPLYQNSNLLFRSS